MKWFVYKGWTDESDGRGDDRGCPAGARGGFRAKRNGIGHGAGYGAKRRTRRRHGDDVWLLGPPQLRDAQRHRSEVRQSVEPIAAHGRERFGRANSMSRTAPLATGRRASVTVRPARASIHPRPA